MRIIVGDFNKASLSSRLHQHVTITTRDNNKLDLCYTNKPDAYKSYKLPPLGSSDHNAVQLIPTYQTRHKLTKNTKIRKQIINDDTIEKCKAVFDTTEWQMFFSEDIDQTAESISDYINFTLSNSTNEEFFTNTKHRQWVKPELRELFKLKSKAVRSNNRHQTKQIQPLIDAEITKAKAEYKEKI